MASKVSLNKLEHWYTKRDPHNHTLTRHSPPYALTDASAALAEFQFVLTTASPDQICEALTELKARLLDHNRKLNESGVLRKNSAFED